MEIYYLLHIFCANGIMNAMGEGTYEKTVRQMFHILRKIRDS